MSEPLNPDLERRRFIAGSAFAGLAATLQGAEVHAAHLEKLASAAGASVVLHDPRIAMPPEVLRRLDANGARMIALAGDPVWLWRSAAGAPLRDPVTRLLGVTNWPDLLVFRGLTAETRRHLRYEKFDASAGIFIWLIA